MKFSTKGWYKVCEEATHYSWDIDDEVLSWDNAEKEYKLRHMEFQPDDFEGMVMLTVEEAKAIQEKLNTFLICAKPRYEKLMKNDINLLEKRIEQATNNM